MHTANAARGKDGDACLLRDPSRGGNGRRSVPAAGNGNWQITATDLVYVARFCNVSKLIRVEADAEFALKDGDGRGRRATLAHRSFKASRCLKILRARQPVRNHGRLKRDERLVRF